MIGDEVDIGMGSVIAEGFGTGELDAGPDCQMFGLDLAEANPSKAVKSGLLVDEKDSYRSKTTNNPMLTTAPTGPPTKPQSQRITVRGRFTRCTIHPHTRRRIFKKWTPPSNKKKKSPAYPEGVNCCHPIPVTPAQNYLVAV